jgi:hypothetical protein
VATYTQLTRNDAGEYIKEIKKSPEIFYLVEYSTIATYYKVDAIDYHEACGKIEDGTAEGIESPDRIDTVVDDWCDEDTYNNIKEKYG